MAVTKISSLRNAMTSLIHVIPDVAGRATPQSLAHLAANVARKLAANQTLCLNFKVNDVIPAALQSEKTQKLSEDLCAAAQKMPDIMTELSAVMAVRKTFFFLPGFLDSSLVPLIAI